MCRPLCEKVVVNINKESENMCVTKYYGKVSLSSSVLPKTMDRRLYGCSLVLHNIYSYLDLKRSAVWMLWPNASSGHHEIRNDDFDLCDLAQRPNNVGLYVLFKTIQANTLVS